MKRLLLGALFLTMFFPSLLLAQSVGAASSVQVLNTTTGPCNNPDATSKPAICGDNAANGANPIFGSSGIVTVVVKIISLLIGFLAIIFLIIQAIKMTASGGDQQAVASARSGIIYALVGLVIAAFAQVLVYFVLDKLT
jgi:tellurite resistance protein TehA-like permease